MSVEPAEAKPADQSDPNPSNVPLESRVGRLLVLVRKPIDYGRELVATLQRDPAARPRQFGTGDIALILARIARGLDRARALEERLVTNAVRLNAPPRARTAPPQRPPRSTQRTTTSSHAGNPHSADLPTPEQIAAAVRRRPIGAVIADICRDLGILPTIPCGPN